MPRLAKPHDQLAKHYDVVIVGSGYGGGISASRLARAGKSVAVLERGREIVTGEFPSRFPELKNDMRVTGKSMQTGRADAVFDVRIGDDMHVLVGSGLGGGSLVNAGVSLEPDERVFNDPVWPDEIRTDGTLNTGYQRARQWLRPTPHTEADNLTKYRSLDQSKDGTNGTMVKPPIAVSFDDNINPAGITQPACTLCGDCCSGCNVGAKNTVAVTYLPDAVRFGAHLFTHLSVTHIEKEATGGTDRWKVLAIKTGTKDKNAPPVAITADTVILSAGTLGSTEILLRSAQNGLAVSEKLGHRFSANGDIIAFGYDAKTEVNAVGIGHPKKIEDVDIGTAVSGQLEIDDEETLENELRIQDGVLPSAIAPVLPVMFVPNGRLLGALKSLISGVYKGPFARLQTFFAVSHDTASGKFSLKDDRLALSWPNAKDEPVYKRLDEKLEKVVTNAGGSYVKNPLAGTVMGHQPATAHPLGGCTMASSHESGVVNHKCQVFDPAGTTPDAIHAGLYVIDGAVIPRSLGVNPLLTISALAERAAIHFATDHGLSFDCEPAAQQSPTTPFDLAVSQESEPAPSVA